MLFFVFQAHAGAGLNSAHLALFIVGELAKAVWKGQGDLLVQGDFFHADVPWNNTISYSHKTI